MRKPARRKPSKPPPAGSRRPPSFLPRRGAGAPSGPLHYKVIELSTVDETSLEWAVNHWVAQGWNLDGVHFAMRDASKRPAMAFVFFTREQAEVVPLEGPVPARKQLHLASRSEPSAAGRDPYRRLAQLAGLEDSETDE